MFFAVFVGNRKMFFAIFVGNRKMLSKNKNLRTKNPFSLRRLNYALKELNCLDSPLNTADGFVLAEVFEDVEDVRAFARAAEQ